MEEDESTFLIAQAKKCRALAKTVSGREAQNTLKSMADEYEKRAAAISDTQPRR